MHRFDCVLPGVITDPSVSMPLCTKDFADFANDTLGFVDLITPDAPSNTLEEFDRLTPNLVTPPVGVEKTDYLGRAGEGAEEADPCLPRCSGFVFALDRDDASHDDSDIQRKDVYLYFSSRSEKQHLLYRSSCCTRDWGG